MEIEHEMIENREQATIKHKKRKRVFKCKNPDCDYETTEKLKPHICIRCGWLVHEYTG